MLFLFVVSTVVFGLAGAASAADTTVDVNGGTADEGDEFVFTWDVSGFPIFLECVEAGQKDPAGMVNMRIVDAGDPAYDSGIMNAVFDPATATYSLSWIVPTGFDWPTASITENNFVGGYENATSILTRADGTRICFSRPQQLIIPIPVLAVNIPGINVPAVEI